MQSFFHLILFDLGFKNVTIYTDGALYLDDGQLIMTTEEGQDYIYTGIIHIQLYFRL